MKAGRGVIKTPVLPEQTDFTDLSQNLSPDDVRLAMLKDRTGLITDPNLQTAVKLANDMAQSMFEEKNHQAAFEIRRLQDEIFKRDDEIERYKRREEVYKDLIARIAPFFNKIKLGPEDRVVSVAIDRGNQIEVVSL